MVERRKKSVAVCSPALHFPVTPDRNLIAMGKLNVKNGTPIGNAHLCKNCSWGQFMIGYRESDVRAICTNTNPNIVVPFTMYECSEFSDKHKPDWEQMEKLAISIQPVRISTRTAGFSADGPVRTIRVAGEETDEDEAARGR